MNKWLIPGGVLAAIVLLGLIIWGSVNSVRNEAIQKEVALSVQYESNQNNLSNMISKFYETTGLADRKSTQMDQILTDAVKGRYDSGAGASPAVDGGKLFSAIREAYPDLKGLDIYDKIVTQLQGDRADYKNVQDKLLDMLRDYDTWRAMGIFRSMALGNFLPSNHLVARIGTTEIHGVDAEKKMYQIVLVQQAAAAYESGVMAPMTMPPLKH